MKIKVKKLKWEITGKDITAVTPSAIFRITGASSKGYAAALFISEISFGNMVESDYGEYVTVEKAMKVAQKIFRKKVLENIDIKRMIIK